MENEFKEIGNTPLLRLAKLETYFNTTCKLYGKYEAKNMTGSIKDRAALYMVMDLINNHGLKKGDAIIEATSGNTGISLAAIGQVLGLHVIIVMPASMSIQRREKMLAYGADLRLINGGMAECHEEAERLNKEIKGSFIIGQFENPNNIKAHIKTTGPELEKQLDNIDYIFAGFGTGGTVTGLSQYFKNKVKVVAIEPMQSPLITKGSAGKHLIQGIGANFVPDNFKKDNLADVISVDDKTSLEYARLINEKEDVFVGFSSGAALLGAINYIKEHKLENKNIVIIFPDKGDRYSW